MEYLTVGQRAKEEYRTEAAIYQEHHRGLGPPAYRIGRRLLFLRSEVEQWRRQQRVGAA